MKHKKCNNDFLLKNLILLIVSTIIWVFAFNAEQLIAFFNIKAHMVESNYISIVFTAQFTIAVLSFTILTILIGTLKEGYAGFTLKDRLEFNFDFRSFIIIPFINIFFAFIFLTLQQINSLSIILVFTIALECLYSMKFIRFIFDKKYINKQINEEIKRRINNKDSQAIIDIEQRLINHFSEISRSNIITNEQKIIIENLNQILLQTQNEDQLGREIYNISQVSLKQFFVFYVNFYGYTDAIKIMEDIFKNCNRNYDIREFYLAPLDKIRFYNDVDMYNSQLSFVFREEDNLAVINDKNNLFFIYREYFDNLYQNCVLSENYKDSLINQFIKDMTHFYEHREMFNNVFNDLLFYIIKYIIILNDQKLFAECGFRRT